MDLSTDVNDGKLQGAYKSLVLVVDDSPIDQRIAGSILERTLGARVMYASDGKRALGIIEGNQPDLILTDLQMPEMDGLELTRALKKQHPAIPVVLMTAQGSEEIATEALRSGATSYIPKRILATHLGLLVDQLLVPVEATRKEEQVIAGLTRLDVEFDLPSDTELVHATAVHLRSYLTRSPLTDASTRLRIYVALVEALNNAIIHGNFEINAETESLYGAASRHDAVEHRRTMQPFCDRRVRVRLHMSYEQAAFVVSDEGPGFDRALVPDPTDAMNIEKETGRGLFLIQNFMDQVRFNRRGNEITMIKNLRPVEPGSTSEG